MLYQLPTLRELFTNLWMPNVTPLMNAISLNSINSLSLNTKIVNDNPYLFNNEIFNKNLPINQFPLWKNVLIVFVLKI